MSDKDKEISICLTYTGGYRIDIPKCKTLEEANEIADALREIGFKVKHTSEVFD